MADDPKPAPLADDLKELALSLPRSVFPKAFFCALCSELAFYPYKLLCCNKTICSPCQAKLSFPTTCPSCDHSPLEADSCTPNKALRNTMRVWLQKQKKKEEAKVAAQAAASAVDSTPAAPFEGEGADKPIASVEEVTAPGDASAETATEAGDAQPRTVSVSAQPNEGSAAPDNNDLERRGSLISQAATQGVDPSAANPPSDDQTKTDEPANMAGNNPMTNGQMGFGFQGQGHFGSIGFNGMSSMMGNANWNNMNPMEYSMNNMYNNFGGNMGMGMNDMSAMNMMNYGGGYGSGWNGMMGGGYGNFNGFNQMGGYNQSGAYPEMMNQFPKNNFQNQNQNRFSANQGGAVPQASNEAGSQAGSVSRPGGQQGGNSRPGSRRGSAQNQRDGESPDASNGAAADPTPEDEQHSGIRLTKEGNDHGRNAQDTAPSVGSAHANAEDADDPGAPREQHGDSVQSNGLNQIQTVDTEDGGMQGYSQSMMGNGMGFPNGMMNQFPNQMQMNAPFDPSMNMGFRQNNNFGPRGGFNAAYGAATVLTGEPQGRGVEGAPTGPRAMREGRPNTGFSSRVNNARYQPPPKSVTPAQSTGARSPQRRVRSRSPQRDENLRTKDKSVSRSSSRSRARDVDMDDRRDQSRSADQESKREGRGRSATPPQDDDNHDHRKGRRHHRSSRYDDQVEDSEIRHRDDRGSRGDRTRSASADSKYRSSRRDKEKSRSARSHRDRSKEYRRRHRSRSPAEDIKHDEDAYAGGDRDSESGSRRKHRSDKDKHRDRSRDKDRERDRRDRRDREKDYDYDREKDRSRDKDKDKDRRRRRDREVEEQERDHDDDKHRSSRRSRKDRDREGRGRDDHSQNERSQSDRESKVKRPAEDDVVGKMMQKRAVSPPLNAPTGPSANTFSIKGAGRSKANVMPPPQPPTGPRGFQPPKGPAADRDKDKHRRKSSVSSVPSTPSTPSEPTAQDHYAAERERNARERNSRDRVDRDQRDSVGKSVHSRAHSSSRPPLSSKRSRDDEPDFDDAPRGLKSEAKPPVGPFSHRDKRRKSGGGGDNSIANLFTAGLRKNAGKSRRGGIRTEGDVEREMERVERERDRR